MKVRDVMSRELQMVFPETTLRDAAERMRSYGIGALPVAEGGELLGFVTDRDITVRATAKGLDPNTTPVRDVMTPGVITCFEEDPLDAAEQLMETHAVRRVVVKNAWHQPVGMLSVDDLARSPEEAEHAAEVLETLNVP